MWFRSKSSFLLSKQRVLLQKNQIYILDNREIQLWLMAKHHNKSITSEQLAYLYMSYIFARYSMLKTIVSNQESPFSSQFIQAFCKKLSIKIKLSTAYYL